MVALPAFACGPEKVCLVLPQREAEKQKEIGKGEEEKEPGSEKAEDQEKGQDKRGVLEEEKIDPNE